MYELWCINGGIFQRAGLFSGGNEEGGPFCSEHGSEQIAEVRLRFPADAGRF